MERRTLAKGLVVSALACFGFVLFAGSARAQTGTTVQGTQNTAGAAGVAGPSIGGNFSGFGQGPTAVAAGGASSQQLGKNAATISQTGKAKVGDAVAGGQVTGVVGDNATVQNSNSAAFVGAVNGPAVVVNATAGAVGPTALSLGPAQTGQSGSNSLDLSQSATTETGDAVAGAQVTGIVGDGEHVVQMQNNCIFSCTALSAPAAAVNLEGNQVGPNAASIAPAQAGQVGNNDAVISQSAVSKTGDALAGSQVTGGVGGSATVQNSNNCLGCLTVSGPAIPVNISATGPGPFVASVINAQASQSGDNSVDLAQDATGSSGDALSGSQVTGWVGDGDGFLTVMNQQASAGDFAFSGVVVPVNVNLATAGPTAIGGINAQTSQNGDNDAVIAQDVNGKSGDALAGAQVTGGVGGDITISGTNSAVWTFGFSAPVLGVNVSPVNSGPVALALITSGASQTGDNSAVQTQTADLASGDAVSGAQVTGAVADGDVRIMNSNNATLVVGDSGSVFGANVGAANAGPVTAGILAAQAQQGGDNRVRQDQSVNASTGDAVAGGQVAGVVAGGDTSISAQNSAFATLSLSGFVGGVNVGATRGGPLSFGGAGASASQLGDNDVVADQTVNTTTGDAVSGGQVLGAVSDGDVWIQGQNNALFSWGASGLSFGLNLGAATAGPDAFGFIGGNASQTGDNAVSFDQAVHSATGDAVSGAEVIGAVADGDVTIMASNTGTLVAGLTGPSFGANFGAGFAGPVSTGILNASTQQGGNNTVADTQTVDSTTGDAVTGSQVIGAVSNDGDITISDQNSANLVLSLSAPAFGANFALNAAGPAAFGALSANTSQFGDNSAGYDQTVNATSGDAVGGSQVVGAVANGSDVTIMGSNSAIGVFSSSLPAVGVNAGASFAGPIGASIIGGSASQFGGNHLTVDQTVNATTGDAVAGSQIAGVVAADDGVVTISNQNSSLGSFAVSGPAIAPNFALAVGGPVSTGLLAAQSQQSGNNSLDYGQLANASTGDAVAGAQVTGVVGGRLAPLQLSNSDNISLGLSGIPVSFNFSAGGLTPTALSLIGARVQTSGDSTVSGSQDFNSNGGDAVSGGQVTGRVGPGASTSSRSGSGAGTPVGGSSVAGVKQP